MVDGAVLVVEDDRDIADMLQLHVEREGYAFHHAQTGEEGLSALDRVAPMVVLLDLGLPDIDGYAVARRIRTMSDVPILMITARDSDIDAIVGFEVGADDYITKPFSPREVMARIGAVLRRASGPRPAATTTMVSGHVVDPGRRLVVRPDGSEARPTAREFDILAYFVENVGLVLSRYQVLDAVWGLGYETQARTVDVHIRQLRKLLPDLPISTVWGVGYQLERT